MTVATPKGVTENADANPGATTEKPAGEIQEDPRLSAMDQIAADNDARRAEEMQHDEDSSTAAPAPKPAKTQTDDQVNQQLEVLPEDSLASTKVKVKIDGVEQEVSVEDMRREFQKNGAADKRLAEATRLLHEAREIAATPAPTVPPVGSDATGRPHDSSTAAPQGAEETRKSFLSALFEGDEDKAMAAMERLGLGAKATQNLDQLTQQLTPAVKQQLADESALDKFAADFDYVVADPYLADLADQHLEAIVKANPKLPYDQALVKAGEATRDWMVSKGMKVPAAEPAPTTDRAKKLAAKAASDQVAGTNNRAQVPEPEPETRSSVIADMRRARGMEA